MASLEEFRAYRSPLKDFYTGKSVLLTGGSGFLGKLLIEKLVKCDVAEILLILRHKKGVSPADRLEQLLDKEPVFVNYAKNPQLYLAKIRVIEGDISEIGIGMANDDLAYVYEHTNIIVHAAADVRFDESLKESVQTNVRGTQEMLMIAEKCRKLEIFTYISTAFSHCVLKQIDETFYEPPIDPSLLIKVSEKATDADDFEMLSKKIIEPWPNTYAFTKSLSEEIVRRYQEKLPIAIIRPSIITTTKEDPIAGWTDNLYGFNGVVCGAATGVLRIFHIHMDYKASIVPADTVINSTLAITWYAATHPGQEHVFNCTTDDNPVSWRETQSQLEQWKDRIAFDKSLWITTYNTTRYKLVADVLAIFYHLLPALLFDAVLKLRGQRPRVLKLYQKVHRFSAVLRFFTNNEWRFRNGRMRAVLDALAADDQRFFPCDPKAIVWNDFLDDQIKGLRLYLMRDPWSTLEWTMPRHRRRTLAHRCLLVLLYGVLFCLIVKILHFYGLLNFEGLHEISVDEVETQAA
ncbi:fatty acyl-CoA reductase wat-like [Anopheles ziemanni]|uniref:fatty acyl-CoA reductase wat-like n=1 Tax=Anopheles coustani TaxID=139045 RepID=UPI0026598002|nr:fatty acyl-CoA reductase wat-like [Anopheles coustani]XP_058177982.1 fatty acyl-CoA reductase wat-like [Anopheles ziemanni]